jgi:hypothetical protein
MPIATIGTLDSNVLAFGCGTLLGRVVGSTIPTFRIVGAMKLYVPRFLVLLA